MHWDIPFLSSPTSSSEKYPEGGEEEATYPWALVILNQPFSRELLNKLWFFCEWRACADGGANRLFDAHGDEQDRKRFLPNLIKGDLDSIRAETRVYYASNNVPIVQDHDQYSTDLMKCVQVVEEIESAQNLKYNILLLGGLSGRLDQTIHTLSYLHKQRDRRPPGTMMMSITDDSVAWVLGSGEHTIDVDRRFIGPTCGLLPVGVAQTTLSTKGLEWNLDSAESSFDGLMSTSNHVIEDTVWIKTSAPIVWTAEVRLSG